MTPTEVTAALGDLLRAAQQQLCTEREFTSGIEPLLARLRNSGLTIGVKVDVVRDAGEVEPVTTYGGPPGKDADAVGTIRRETGSFRFTIEAWYYREAATFDPQRCREVYQAILDPLASIMGEHWGTRDTMTLLPLLKGSGQKPRLEKAVQQATVGGDQITLLYLDLDHFKDVNTNFGYQVGNAVLREFGTRVRTSLFNRCIAVRDGGDEYALFFPNSTHVSVLAVAETFRHTMEGTAFAQIDRALTCSIGIASFPTHVPANTTLVALVDALLSAAMSTLQRAKDAGRNCIRIPQSLQPAARGADESVNRQDLVEAALWARRNLAPQDATCFGDELHTFLAENLFAKFERSGIEKLAEEVGKTIRTFGIEVTFARAALHYGSVGAAPTIHAVKLASIVIHALLRLAMDGRGPLVAGDELHLSVANDGDAGKTLAVSVRRAKQEAGRIMIVAVSPDNPDLDVYAGQIWVSRPGQPGAVPRWIPPVGTASLSPVLLLAVGQASLNLHLQPWVAAVVEVDDRPVSGGGLPDFWESNISRVIHAVLNNPNIERILAVGDENSAARTLQVLDTLAEQSTARLTQRLSIDVDALETFKRRNLAVYRAPSELPAAVDAIERAYFADEAALTTAAEPRDLRRERILQRRIPMTGFSAGAALGHADGIRCGTLAEAYPRIVDMLRSMSGMDQSDHMSRKFCELTGFKLVLETPTAESIPYYWSQEVSSLDEYVDKQFVQAEGLFAQALKGTGPRGAGKDQFQEAVIAAVSAIKEAVASRRIIMIAAHPQGDWHKPLGLVCVHVVPRVIKGRWKLHFQWVWRTVEALVGLPFSAYGSIRQSESLLQQVNTALGERPVPVEMGEVVYFALSLHMFLDEGDKDIARTIVLDAYA